MEEPVLRRTWAEIDLDALGHNYQQARRKIGPNVKYLGVVKADAYGHGAIQVSRKLEQLGADERTVELARIAGYMHDIGNLGNRVDHAQSGAVMAFRILGKMGMPPADTALVVTAIGNHDEGTAYPAHGVAAALILADKSDVRRSRVRNRDTIRFDIHDRVNWAVERSDLELDKEQRTLTLRIQLDTSVCPVMDYFEIFLDRMLLCRKAAEYFKLTFRLEVNGQTLL